MAIKPVHHVPVNEAKTRLTQLLPRVEAGERVVITRRGRPVADLVQHAPDPPPIQETFLQGLERRKRAVGIEKFQGKVPIDFDDPLPEEFWISDDDIVLGSPRAR